MGRGGVQQEIGLGSGHVPVERVRAFLDETLHLEGYFGYEHDALLPLLRMWGVSDRMWKKLSRGEGWMEFNVADKMLCLLGLQGRWREDLEDIYLLVNLDAHQHARVVPAGHHRCERAGCSSVFSVTGRRQHKRFCCDTCRSSEHQLKTGTTTTSVRGPGRRLESLRCRNGHERTEENTRTFERDGKTITDCRICQRASMQRYRDRKAVAA